MLIEAKGPTAVIPMDEYERLKKIEDKWDDNIDSLRQRYEERYQKYIKDISDNPDYKLVIIGATEGNIQNMRFVEHLFTNEELVKMINKVGVISTNPLEKSRVASFFQKFI